MTDILIGTSAFTATCMYHDFPTPEDGCCAAAKRHIRTINQISAKCGVKMRYEVRQQDEKWIVWDTVNDCAMKGVAGPPRLPTLTAANCMRHPSIAGLLVMKPNSVASLVAEARPVTFWTQKEAQVCVDTLNDIDQLGSV